MQKLIKKEKKSPTLYLTVYNVLIAQNLWQAHYQILLITSLKEFMKLNLYKDTMIKSVKLVELYTRIASVFYNTQTLKMI